MVARKSSRKDEAKPDTRGSGVAPTPAVRESGHGASGHPPSPFALKDWQYLLKERLSEPVLTLFTELTGLPLHVVWHQPQEPRLSGRQDFLCPTARRISDSGGKPTIACRVCLEQCWHPAAFRTDEGRRFIGRCATSNLCVSLKVVAPCPLSLVLHARIKDGDSKTSEPRESGPRGRPISGLPVTSECRVTAEAFQRAESLLRLVMHDLEATLHARLAEGERDSAQRKLERLGAADAQRHNDPQRGILKASATPVRHSLGSQACRIVQAMMDYAHQQCSHPMGLKQVATHLRMNTNYLSGLFHKTTGMTFHCYLAELRLVRAKELLRDPRTRICEVAAAAGYASPNHFRNVFKAHEGLSPRVWRENPPAGCAAGH